MRDRGLASEMKAVTKTRAYAWAESNAVPLSLAITLAGALLRIYQLGARSLWFDEAIEVLVARAPLAQMQVAGLAWSYADPPLYSWLLHLTMKISPSEIVLHVPTVLAGMLAVYASFHLFRLWVDAPTALMAQVLIALAPAQVYYSQEVNQYALMVALGVAVTWAFERAVRRTDWTRVLVFSALCAAGIFSHYGMLWYVAGLAIVIVFRQKPKAWLAWWPAILIIGLATLLLVVTVTLPQLRAVQSLTPSAPLQLGSLLSIAELRGVAAELLNTARLFTDYAGAWPGQASIVTWLFVLLFLIGTWTIARRPEWRPTLALLWVPLLVSYAANKLGLYFWGMRYLLFLSPMYYLVVSIGVLALTRLWTATRVVPVACAVALLVFQLYPGWPNSDPGEHIRPVIRYIQDHPETGDGVYVYYGAWPAFLVYYTGPMDDVKIGEWFRDKPLPEKMADIDSFTQSHPRLWFVASHMIVSEVNAILESLDQRCARVESLNQPNALAVEYNCTAIKQVR